jgi:hypothetical protein
MLAEELAALAGTSATTLVAAMTTDAWQSVRSGVARLFGRANDSRQKAVESQLDSNAELLAQVDDPERARQNLVGLWQLELERLLSEHPDAASELQALMAQARKQLPPAQQTWIQTIVARGGLSFGVQGGNVFFHGPAWQPPLSAASEDIKDGDALP